MLLRDGQDENEAEQSGCTEEHGGVLLHASGLDVAEDPAALLGGETGAVGDPVDDLLIHDVADEVRHLATDPRHAVDEAIDDVLVEPVDGACYGVLDRADDAVDIDLVEVVLLLEEVVAGAGQAAASSETVGALVG